MKCYLCGKEIKENQEAVGIGKGLVRHKKCKPGTPRFMGARKSETLNKRSWVKQSGKVYDRKKAKQNLRKEIEKDV